MKVGSFAALVGALLAGALVLACGSDDEGNDLGPVTTGDAGVQAGPGGSAGTDANVQASPTDGGGSASGMATPGGGAMDAGSTPVPSKDAGGAQMGGSSNEAGSPTGDGGGSPSTPATGPLNGDPAKPVVTAEGVPCRMAGAGGGSFGGLGSPNAMVGGRDMIVDYPCGKREGAHMTIVLNLHGTLIGGAPWQYQRGYFSAYRFVDSHNLIVLHPHSVSMAPSGAQWGNMDGGADLPHLLAAIEWAYKTFSKFQIRGLWIGGHSWGAAFAVGRAGGGPLVCNPAIKDKVKGGIGMSRLSVPSCASSLSLIATRGELEMPVIPLIDQSRPAMEHGCMVPNKGPVMVGNNQRFFWEGCKPGWVHEDYNMLGKEHADSMDQEVVKSIVDAIKSTEK